MEDVGVLIFLGKSRQNLMETNEIGGPLLQTTEMREREDWHPQVACKMGIEWPQNHPGSSFTSPAKCRTHALANAPPYTVILMHKWITYSNGKNKIECMCQIVDVFLL